MAFDDERDDNMGPMIDADEDEETEEDEMSGFHEVGAGDEDDDASINDEEEDETY